MKTDPHLISGFLSAVIPRMKEFGYTLDQLHAEMSDDGKGYMEINLENGWISVGFASEDVNHRKLRNVLRSVSQIAEQHIGPPKEYIDLSKDDIRNFNKEIDVLIAQKGMTTKSSHFADGKGILPVVNQVFEGNMKPKEAAKILMKTIENEKSCENELENIKNSLKYIDQLLPETNQLSDLQVVIKATYQGVSKLTVRMDNELMF